MFSLGNCAKHTASNPRARNFCTVAYRTVRWLSVLFGGKTLPAEARCAFEQRMHINELTLGELKRLLAEAGLECDAKPFGPERLLAAVREAGFGRRMDAFLRSLACKPSLRKLTSSDLIGTGARYRGVIDERIRLPARGAIPLDHPVFFHEGWYVPVTGDVSPHRWSSPSFSLRGWCDEIASIDLLLGLQAGSPPWVRVRSAPEGFELSTSQEAESLRLSLRWPPTHRPEIVRLSVSPHPRVASDPRPLGAYLKRAARL